MLRLNKREINDTSGSRERLLSLNYQFYRDVNIDWCRQPQTVVVAFERLWSCRRKTKPRLLVCLVMTK